MDPQLSSLSCPQFLQKSKAKDVPSYLIFSIVEIDLQIVQAVTQYHLFW